MAHVKHLEESEHEVVTRHHNPELLADDKQHNDDSIFDDAEALIALAQASFKRAAKKAVAENDALGIPTHGAINGKLVVHMPPQKKATRTLR